MLAGCYLAIFLACGVVITRFLLPHHQVLNRIWIGMSMGLLLMMWLPALWAFALRFSMAAHWAALGTLMALTGGVCTWGIVKKPKVHAWDAAEKRLLVQIAAVCIPLTILSGYLQYTHMMRVDTWGSWHVGQSTYGDLPMHLSFITGAVDRAFPLDYPFYPGQQLSYPFLMDTLSTSLYMMGFSLQLSMIVPGTLMMALCYVGVMVLGRDMTRGKKTIVLAALLFFLNGGLGFLYDFDQAAGFESDDSLTVWRRIELILKGYYKTPTNQPDPNNLRWSNIIADLFIPQRTLLGGYCMLLPCLYLLYGCFAPEKRGERYSRGGLMLLGVWGGALPLIHTHSFLALGLCSAGMMVYDMIHDRERWLLLRRYLTYAAITVVLAAPQLICFTFAQTFQQEGASKQAFLALQFNWVNNPGGRGMRDFYFWFYIKNIGLPFIGLILALFERDKHARRLFAGAFAIILAAELIRFQPNEYDNNKLFYVAWLLSCMIVADYAARLWRMMAGLRARPVIAAACAVAVFLSAGLTLWRECVSDYEAYSDDAIEAAEFIRENTDTDAVLLTGTQHLNPLCAVAGRQIVCGPNLWLYWHGVDTTQRNRELRAFYENPEENVWVVQKYNVSCISVTAYERGDYDVDIGGLDALYERVFENDYAIIWRVPEG